MYSYLTDNNTNVKKCKGIKKCVVDEMTHEDYNKCLKEKEIIRKSQKIFKSKLHKVYTVEVNKIALSYNDDNWIISEVLTNGFKGYSNYADNELMQELKERGLEEGFGI